MIRQSVSLENRSGFATSTVTWTSTTILSAVATTVVTVAVFIIAAVYIGDFRFRMLHNYSVQ